MALSSGVGLDFLHEEPSGSSRIFVQSISETSEKGRLIEFHLVDLNQNTLELNCSPSLTLASVPTTLVALGHSIYMFGCVDRERSPTLISSERLYLGSSRLDFDQGLWSPTPSPVKDLNYPICTTLFGNIYTFGTLFLEPAVFDAVAAQWNPLLPLPQHLDGCEVSEWTLQDSSNGRILVHLFGGQLSSPSLYAFMPPDDHHPVGTWTCIAPDFYYWSPIAAVDDNIIYVHVRKCPRNLLAYDIANATWLTVQWSSSFDFNKKMDLNNTRMDFNALLSLRDRVFCLAVWSPVCDSDYQYTTKIRVAKFKVKREHNHPTVTLIPISSHSYVVPDTCRVWNFLAF